MQRALLYSFCLVLAINAAHAQEIQNTLSYRDIGSDHYFRVNYLNDLAFRTDYYYTQGAHLELVSPRIGALPTHVLFPRMKQSIRRYGLALESAGYTPTTIFADSILRGDRPFAGTAYLKAFMIATDTSRKSRLSTVLTAGLMGPTAGGYEIQAAIHRRTGNADPVGWKHQIGNALILNYELNYERALLSRKAWLISGTGMVRAGTYGIKAAAGSMLMAGWFANPFQQGGGVGKAQAYLYVHPQIWLIAYDATLQGGLFTDNSPYTIGSGELSRAVFRLEGGLRIGYRGTFFGIYALYMGKEFSTGLDHATGGIELAFAL